MKSIKILRKKDKLLIASELCLVFIGVDTFSRFYKILYGQKEELDKEISKRFKKWLDDFVFTKENKIYRKHKNKIKCDSGMAWKLRCSLLHFYGLPKLNNEYISIGTLPITEEAGLKKLVRKTRDKGIRQINPNYLMKAILHGLLLHFKHMKDMIKNNPDEYIKGVLDCCKIMEEEGIVYVDGGKIKAIKKN